MLLSVPELMGLAAELQSCWIGAAFKAGGPVVASMVGVLVTSAGAGMDSVWPLGG